jgi:tetratricopeptide (TPR) repeat protein
MRRDRWRSGLVIVALVGSVQFSPGFSGGFFHLFSGALSEGSFDGLTEAAPGRASGGGFASGVAAGLVAITGLVAEIVAVLGPRPAAAAPARDRREMRAREAYAAGRYQDALEIYVKLYAEKLHPNFLRNIGRCYQNLAEPDKAISSFKEYLRKARRLDRGEREEIDGYIREMEQLKQARAAATEPPPPPADPLPSGPLPPAAAVDPAPPSINLQATAPPPEPDPTTPPIYRRWWFWTAVGAAVLGGAAVVLFARKGSDMPTCDAGRSCL